MQTEYVLVETVVMFRHRYVIEVPIDKSEYALDSVVCNDAKEFSQKYLDENIVSHRTITRDDALTLCDRDNPAYINMSDEMKQKLFFTPLKVNKE